MKFSKYFISKFIEILIVIFGYIIALMMLFAFKASSQLVFGISITFLVICFAVILTGYLKRRRFYNNLISNTEKLDKKYLVLEMLNKPSFYDGEVLYEVLYEINKSMNENVKKYEMSLTYFKEYIELWIHEIKLPIASLMLMNHNQKNKVDKRYEEQIKRIDDYVDQVLYYVRSENAEKDYLIKEVSLKKIINNVAMKNKDDLLDNNINFISQAKDEVVLTDSKWLEFIINQIISNSIKYKKDKDSFIKLSVNDLPKQVDLHIIDNGIGIPAKDIGRVFEKTFTGENGRNSSKSTGMGLYIVKKLCEKLGHKIKVLSVQNEYTEVIISFSKDDFYKVR